MNFLSVTGRRVAFNQAVAEEALKAKSLTAAPLLLFPAT